MKIPKEQLSRSARREAMEASTSCCLNGNDPRVAIEQYILQVYYGASEYAAARGSWFFFDHQYDRIMFRRVERALHMEVAMHLALNVAKRLRLSLEKDDNHLGVRRVHL